MSPTPRWEIPVLDTHARPVRFVVIVDARRNVVILPPPGAAWILPPRSDDKLITAIREAREWADQQSGSSC